MVSPVELIGSLVLGAFSSTTGLTELMEILQDALCRMMRSAMVRYIGVHFLFKA